MEQVIAICNLKGGVGKTTLAAHLPGPLLEAKKRVLLVDLDHQANLTSVYLDDYDPDRGPGIGKALWDPQVKLSDIIQPASSAGLPGLAIAPADLDLVELDRYLGDDLNAPYRLSELLETLYEKFDYILIDTPPNLGMPTRMALIAATGYLVPIAADSFSLQGINRLEGEALRVQQRANPKLKRYGYVVNHYAKRNINDAHLEEIKGHFPDRVLPQAIRSSVKYREAMDQGRPITHHPRAGQKTEWAEDVRVLRVQMESQAEL